MNRKLNSTDKWQLLVLLVFALGMASNSLFAAAKKPLPAKGAETYMCGKTRLTKTGIAAHRRISVKTFDLLRTRRGLTPEEICSLSPALLARAIQRGEHPKEWLDGYKSHDHYAGGSVTATWANIVSPTATDWLALYNSSGAPNSPPVAWRDTNGLASSSLPFIIPQGAVPGATYELRLWSINGYTRLATSNSFTIAAATLTVGPTTIPAGGTVTATWANIANPSATDWLALYASSAASE